MEILSTAVIALLIFIVIFLVWQAGRKVPRDLFRQAEQDRNQARLELAAAQERERLNEAQVRKAEELLETERRQRIEAEKALEKTRAELQAQREKFGEQQQEIAGLREQFRLEFQHMANAILEEKTQKFTTVNQQHLSQILDPLKEKIKAFEEKVDRSYQQEAAERNVLKGTVKQLMQHTELIKMEANNLTNALKGDVKKQGIWGEVVLERVLERSGLEKNREYRLQFPIQEDGGRKIPDAIIDLPDDKQIVVDSKVSLTAYERWANATDEAEQATALKQHVESVMDHVRRLSDKDYQNAYGIHSPAFVLLFMPIESAFSAAMRERPDLFAYGWDKNIVIVTPATLLATLRTVASIWVQERQNRNVLEIAKQAGALYDKFKGFLDDMEQLENHLHKAIKTREDAMKKLTSGPGNVTKRIENLKTLGAKANKQIDAGLLESASTKYGSISFWKEMKFFRTSASVTAVKAKEKTMFLLHLMRNVSRSSGTARAMALFWMNELNSRNSRSSDSVLRYSCALADSRMNAQPMNSLHTVYATRLTRRIVSAKKPERSFPRTFFSRMSRTFSRM